MQAALMRHGVVAARLPTKTKANPMTIEAASLAKLQTNAGEPNHSISPKSEKARTVTATAPNKPIMGAATARNMYSVMRSDLVMRRMPQLTFGLSGAGPSA